VSRGDLVMLSAPSFLIAEGDPSLRHLLAEITADYFPRASIYQARDEGEALAALPSLQAPCVAVIHWSLLDDASTLLQFRNARVPVLLTSAWDSRIVNGAGPVTARLQKPFHLHEYLELLKDLLAGCLDPTSGVEHLR